MKLQFQPERLRIRLQAGELDQLLAGEHLNLVLGPEAVLGTCVLFAQAHASADYVKQERTLQISLPQHELAELRLRLPSKAGLTWSLDAGASFELSLDVDVRTR